MGKHKAVELEMNNSSSNKTQVIIDMLKKLDIFEETAYEELKEY